MTNAYKIFDSYLQNGFSETGFFNEVVHYRRNFVESVHSIRRQSEGVYALLHFLNYERLQGRKHPEWEKRIKSMLDMFLRLQNKDGSFPRKFKDDFSIVDKSGGSTLRQLCHWLWDINILRINGIWQVQNIRWSIWKRN